MSATSVTTSTKARTPRKFATEATANNGTRDAASATVLRVAKARAWLAAGTSWLRVVAPAIPSIVLPNPMRIATSIVITMSGEEPTRSSTYPTCRLMCVRTKLLE